MNRPATTSTTFGTVARTDSSTVVSATGDQLRDWARRGDCSWPCSTLATLDGVAVTFDSRGDLVAIEGDERADLACDELDAWSAEVLVRAGFPNHPAIRGYAAATASVAAVAAETFGLAQATAIVAPPSMDHRPEHERWMTDPADRDYLPPVNRWCRVCARPDREHICTTCNRPADARYENRPAGEHCADKVHEPFYPAR